jgi:hypothetical protein
MSPAAPRPGPLQVVLKQLSNPLKLRFALCAAIIAVWQVGFFSPLSEEVTATTARIARERKRVATAREVERFKKALAPYREVAGSDDVHELIRHVMGRIRPSPLRLLDLKPDKPKDLGPFLAIGLKLSLEGRYNDIDEFLGWVEAEKRAMRVDSIQLTPEPKDPSRLTANLTLVALADRIAPATNDQAQSRPAAKAKAQPGPAAKAKAQRGPTAKAGSAAQRGPTAKAGSAAQSAAEPEAPTVPATKAMTPPGTPE